MDPLPRKCLSVVTQEREFSVYPVLSPLSLIGEGTAVYSLELAFPLPERIVFERDVLYPLADLDPDLAKSAAPELIAQFITRYRSYIVAYAVGLDLVKRQVEKQAGADGEKRWQEFERLQTPPRMPSDLR